MKALHETFGYWMVGGCPGKLKYTHFGQGVEELRLKLTSLVGGDGLRATKRDIQPLKRARTTVSAVMSGMGMASGQRVKQSTAGRQYV
jgi:hypothetical protein